MYLIVTLLFLIDSANCFGLPMVSEILVDDVVRGNLFIDLPDIYRTPCQLIESRNFICDEHFLTTEDGYILSAQHLMHPEFVARNKSTIKPVILQHGLFGSATNWLINSEGGFAADWTDGTDDIDLYTEGRNLAYLLANLGYDVWVTNIRGCRFSLGHVYLDYKADADYWKFSYDQMIQYDAPLFIDYILGQTGYSSLAWIGHSMGTLIIFGLFSERPEYAVKVDTFIALAPVAHTGHIETALRVYGDVPAINKLLYEKGGEFDLPKPIVDLVIGNVCGLSVVDEACSALINILGGLDFEQTNATRTPVYIANGFSGTSTWTVVHFGSNIRTNRFAKFDFGPTGNLERYGTVKPPLYNLSSINSTKMVLINSLNDLFADLTDVDTLKSDLTVPFYEYTVAYAQFTHLDFLFAENVYQEVYEKVVYYLQKLGNLDDPERPGETN